MRRLLSAVGVAAIGLVGAGVAARPALADTLCVGATKTGALAHPHPALDAAGAGDTIAIGPGTFAGGITILKSVQLVGVAAGATVIRGGGTGLSARRAVT